MAWPSELLVSASAADLSDADAHSWWAVPLILLLMMVPMGPVEATALTSGASADLLGLAPVAAGVILATGMFLGDLMVFLSAAPLRRRLDRCTGIRLRLLRWEERISARPAVLDLAVVCLRLLPGARTPAALAAHSGSMGTARFCLLAAAGSALWAVVWTGAATAAERTAPGLLLLAGVLALGSFIAWRRGALTPPVPACGNEPRIR